MASKVAELQEQIDSLQGCIDAARDTLDAVNSVTASRTELAQAVVSALEALSPEEEEEEEEELEEDDDE